METGLFTVTRACEVDKEIARVWEVWSNFENWGSWTKFGFGSLSLRQRLSWVGGRPGQGEHVTVEFHALKISDCVMLAWDPPRSLFLSSTIPKGQRNYFDVGLTFTALAPAKTRVDFTTTMDVPPLGPIGWVIPVRRLVENKIDSIILTAVGML